MRQAVTQKLLVTAALLALATSIIAIGTLSPIRIFSGKAQAAPILCNDGTPAPKGDANRCGHCSDNNFFGFKPWYAYIPLKDDCSVNLDITSTNNSPSPSSINKFWLIGLAVFEDLLRIAGIVAIVFVVYGGVQYITSQGEPDKTAQARSTVINALIGLVIAVAAATIVTFIGGNIK